MDPHRRMGICVGFKSPSILKHPSSITGDLFTV
jgi:hypothetical protein